MTLPRRDHIKAAVYASYTTDKQREAVDGMLKKYTKTPTMPPPTPGLSALACGTIKTRCRRGNGGKQRKRNRGLK